MRPMALNEYEKEEALQQVLIENRLNECEQTDPEVCRAITTDAARIAYEHFSRIRFGCFCGDDCCVVYVNMGPTNQSARDRFRRMIDEAGASELGVAVWPLGDAKDAHYTWAAMIADADAGKWVDEAKAAWIAETNP